MAVLQRRAVNTPTIASGVLVSGNQAPGLGTAAVGLTSRGAAKKVLALGGRCTMGAFGGRSQLTTTTPTKVAPIAGRVTLGLGGGGTVTAIVASGAYTHVVVTRDYDLATGEAPSGVVYFTPSTWLLNSGVTLVPAPVPATLNDLGQISISLAANNDPDTTPAGSHYQVREVIAGQPERTYKVVIPCDIGPTVDLSILPELA